MNDQATDDDQTAETNRPSRNAPLAARHCRPAECRQIEPAQPAARRGALAHEPEAGITRDAVAAEWRWGERDIRAPRHRRPCARRRASSEKLEKLSVESTLSAMRFADCVILVIDANEAFEKQDLAIADLIAREGRAIVFAVNKWDLVENRADRAARNCASAPTGCCRRWRARPIVALSALTGEGDRAADAGRDRSRPHLEHARVRRRRSTASSKTRSRAMPRRRSRAGASASAT